MLCLDSSSFASLAYFCRGEGQPAVVGVKHVKHFFRSDVTAEWPPHLVYSYKGLQKAAEATNSSAWDAALLATLERGLRVGR